MMPRACSNCRVRKVRCNRILPCSNCVTSGLACHASTKASTLLAATQGRGVELLSPSNSNESDDLKALKERVLALEESITDLRQLLHSQVKTQSPDNDDHVNREILEANVPSQVQSPFPEGDVSLVRQILFASQVTELTPHGGIESPAVIDEVTNLRSMAQGQAMMQEETPQSVLDSEPELIVSPHGSRRALPPAEFVLKLLRSIKGTQSILFLLFGVNDKAQVEDLCRRIYFPIEPLSAADMTLFHGMLAILMVEQECIGDDELQEPDKIQLRSVCEANFQAGVERFEIMAIPTYEHALILSLAMILAQKEAKIRLQWSLTSAAARHCLALGYHREEHIAQMAPIEGERVRRLFWHVYSSDKHLSSRLGRTAIIQDHDLDVKECAISPDPGRAPWDSASLAFVELSRIQAFIYDSLYSVSAKKIDETERRDRVSRLSKRLQDWHDVWTGVDASRAYHKKIFECTFGPVEMVYYSILTLVYRGSTMSNSTEDISHACFGAAHRGLQAHLRLYSESDFADPLSMSYYAVWLFYYTAFTPFVVIFLRCISNSNVEDLNLLGNVLDTLERLGTSFEYAKRQCELCKALYRAAKAYLDSRSPNMGDIRRGQTSDEVSLPLQSIFDHEWLDFQQYSHVAPFQGLGAEDWENNVMD